MKLRINAGDKNASNAQDKAIADAYGNKFIIPLDFEMLDSAAPYYQAGLSNHNEIILNHTHNHRPTSLRYDGLNLFYTIKWTRRV